MKKLALLPFSLLCIASLASCGGGDNGNTQGGGGGNTATATTTAPGISSSKTATRTGDSKTTTSASGVSYNRGTVDSPLTIQQVIDQFGQEPDYPDSAPGYFYFRAEVAHCYYKLDSIELTDGTTTMESYGSGSIDQEVYNELKTSSMIPYPFSPDGLKGYKITVKARAYRKSVSGTMKYYFKEFQVLDYIKEPTGEVTPEKEKYDYTYDAILNEPMDSVTTEASGTLFDSNLLRHVNGKYIFEPFINHSGSINKVILTMDMDSIGKTFKVRLFNSAKAHKDITVEVANNYQVKFEVGSYNHYFETTAEFIEGGSLTLNMISFSIN